MKIVFFLASLSQPRCIKRIKSLHDAGCDVEVYGYYRGFYDVNVFPKSISAINWGNVKSGEGYFAKFIRNIRNIQKVVKNYRKSYDKFIRQVIEYQSSMKFLAQNKSVLFKSIFYTVVDFILFCSIGFFTSMAFTQTVTIENFASGLWLWLISLARYQVVDMASTIMILPGGTGVKEIAFLIMYNVFFKNTDTVAWSFLSWRMFDYYFFLIVGFVFIIVRFIIGLCKNSKKKKLKNAEVAEVAQNAKIKQE